MASEAVEVAFYFIPMALFIVGAGVAWGPAGVLIAIGLTWMYHNHMVYR